MDSAHWTRQAINDLTALCVAQPTRWADIDAAEQAIADLLQRDPLHGSQAVSEGLRKIVRPSPFALRSPSSFRAAATGSRSMRWRGSTSRAKNPTRSAVEGADGQIPGTTTKANKGSGLVFKQIRALALPAAGLPTPATFFGGRHEITNSAID